MGCGFEATETLCFERHGACQIYDAVSVAKRFVNVGTRGEVVSCMFGSYSVRGWINYGTVLGAVAKKKSMCSCRQTKLCGPPKAHTRY